MDTDVKEETKPKKWTLNGLITYTEINKIKTNYKTIPTQLFIL
jgi:hypothetical protein